jgi:uncharacterized protein (TIGR02118 family)
VVRSIVLYEEEPDAAQYEEHVELCRKVPGAKFWHGRIFGSPMGESPYRYYAEFEWPDMESFQSATRSDEFTATGKHAMEMGVKFTVLFAEVD